ncbi:MAG: acetylxylan esterase [Pirellulaceae bacterium]
MNSNVKRAGFISMLVAVIGCLFTAELVAGEEKLRRMRYTSRSKEEAIAWQKELRSKLLHILEMDDLIQSRSDIPLNPETVSSENKGTYVFQELEINSTPGRRIKIVLTRPAESTGPFPAVVCVAGHGGDRHTCYGAGKGYDRVGERLAERGYVTISTRVSQHKVYEEGRTLMGERLWDLMRCVDLLSSLEEVDDERMGCAGKSLGGEMVMWLSAMDQRMRATVSAGFLTRMDQMEENHCMCWKFPGLRQLVDFADIYSLIAPRALQCQNGLKEPPSQFPVSIAREAMKEIKLIYRDFGQPENVALVAHDGGHVFDVPSLLAFFDKHLEP